MHDKLNIPDVSVIMPAYNAEKTIHDSITSVLAQTYQNWELIIIDDASGDKTAEIANAFAVGDTRIRIFANKINQGVAAARNMGILQSNSSYIAFLDSDDMWHEDKLMKQLQFMQSTNATITYTATAYIYEETHSNYTLRAEKKLSYKGLLRRNIMSCSSVMVRRSAMIPFPQGRMHEDYAVWLQIVKKCGCANGVDEPLLVYRVGNATKSAKRIASAIMIFNSYRYVGYSLAVSMFFTFRYAWHSISKRLRVKFYS